MRKTFILAYLMALLAGTSAQATLFTVSSNSGGSPANECTLVKAVQAANTNVAVAPCPAGSSLETDEIFVNVFGTIVLDQTLVVEDALIIRGISAGVTRLNGDNQRQIIRVNMQNLADNFTLQDIQIEEARTNSNTFAGAVQLMRGKAFDIQDVIFESNTTFTHSGGAIHAGPLQGIEDAALTIRSSRFQNNYAEDYGGAVYSATIDDQSTALSSLTIQDSVFRFNTSELSGSAIMLYRFDQMYVTNTLFDGNETGASGTVSLSHNTLNQPFGYFRESTFKDNTATRLTAGIHATGTTLLAENSTFADNITTNLEQSGGAIFTYNESHAGLYFNTFFNNSDGRSNSANIAICSDCGAFLRGNIIYTSPTTDNDCYFAAPGGITSLGFNLDGDGSCTSSVDDLPPQDPLLRPLNSYGGVDQNLTAITMPPRSVSNVIDVVEPNLCRGVLNALVSRDQRGYSRPVDGNDNGDIYCDVGATEFQPGTDLEDGLLSLNITSGFGRLSAHPIGANCKTQCNYLLAPDTDITITPVPDPGYVFDGFSGDCNGTGACTFQMDADRSVSASFSATLYTLTTNVVGNGSISSAPAGIQCPGDCSHDYTGGTVVSLTATPEPGWVFDGWSGGCLGSAGCTVLMNPDQNVTATFKEDTAFLLVNVNGGARVSSTPAGIDCPGTCSFTFPNNTDVTLTAVPDEGWTFDHWSGDCSSTEITCQMSLTGDHTVTASLVFTDRIFQSNFEGASR